MIPHLSSRVKRNFDIGAIFCINFRFRTGRAGVKGLKKYETYELFQSTALLLALAVVLASLKIPGFSAALPFAMLPSTVCAGIAAHLHRKLPEEKKRSLFSRLHPMRLFIPWLIGNAVLFLLPLIEPWRR